jgi:hypothetical protein
MWFPFLSWLVVMMVDQLQNLALASWPESLFAMSLSSQARGLRDGFIQAWQPWP